MVRVYALGLSIFLAASTAFAQVSATTGAINGKVTDNSGGVLPGVTVTASSPSMQGVRTDVTNESGEYRFPAVAPGTYNLLAVATDSAGISSGSSALAITIGVIANSLLKLLFVLVLGGARFRPRAAAALLLLATVAGLALWWRW